MKLKLEFMLIQCTYCHNQAKHLMRCGKCHQTLAYVCDVHDHQKPIDQTRAVHLESHKSAQLVAEDAFPFVIETT